MKDTFVFVLSVIAIGAICVVMGPRILAAWPGGGINLPAPQPTLSAGDAAANATMVAQQQLAEIEVSAAQVRAQATAQAAAAHATRQAMVADQALLDEAAARRAESTAQAVCATAEHERLVAAAVSAAEAARVQSTAVAATATRQVEENRMTATIESRHATATRQAAERSEKETDQRHTRRIWKARFQAGGCWFLAALSVLFAAGLITIALSLLRQGLKHMGKWPSTLRALLFIWNKYTRREK